MKTKVIRIFLIAALTLTASLIVCACYHPSKAYTGISVENRWTSGGSGASVQLSFRPEPYKSFENYDYLRPYVKFELTENNIGAVIDGDTVTCDNIGTVKYKAKFGEFESNEAEITFYIVKIGADYITELDNLAFGVTSGEVTLNAGEAKWFKLDLAQQTTIGLDVTSISGGGELTAGLYKAQLTDYHVYLPSIIAAGTYYVKLANASGNFATGSVLADNFSAIAEELTLNVASDSFSLGGSDFKWYKLVLTQETPVVLSSEMSENRGDSGKLKIDLYAENDLNTVLATVAAPKSLAAGTYFVRANSYPHAVTGSIMAGSVDGQTALTFGSAAPQVKVSTKNYDYSANGYSDAAEYSWYKLVLAQETVVSLSVQAQFLSGDSNLKAVLYAESDLNTILATEAVPKNLAAGTYLVGLTSTARFAKTTGSVRIDDLNANELSLNAPSQPVTLDYRDFKWYKLTVSSNMPVELTANKTGGDTASFSLKVYSGNNFTNTIAMPSVFSAGTYYVKLEKSYITNATITGTLKASDGDILTPGVWSSVSASNSADKWFKIVLSQATPFLFDVTGGTGTLIASLYSSNNFTSYTAQVSSSSTSVGRSGLLNLNGTYYVRMWRSGSGTGTASGQVRLMDMDSLPSLSSGTSSVAGAGGVRTTDAWYKITLTSTTSVQIRVDRTSTSILSHSFSAALYSISQINAGNLLSPLLSATNTGTLLTDWSASSSVSLAAGMYIVRVYGDGGVGGASPNGTVKVSWA